jgi:hypothetical protein
MRTAGKILAAAALTAGALVASACPASAAPAAHCYDINQSSGANYGILNGTNIAVPIAADVDITRNALAILGLAGASGDDTTTVNC